MSEANEVKRRRQDGLEAVREFMDLEAEVDDDDGDEDDEEGGELGMVYYSL